MTKIFDTFRTSKKKENPLKNLPVFSTLQECKLTEKDAFKILNNLDKILNSSQCYEAIFNKLSAKSLVTQLYFINVNFPNYRERSNGIRQRYKYLLEEMFSEIQKELISGNKIAEHIIGGIVYDNFQYCNTTFDIFEQAHKLNPENEYISKRLELVRDKGRKLLQEQILFKSGNNWSSIRVYDIYINYYEKFSTINDSEEVQREFQSLKNAFSKLLFSRYGVK